MLPYCSNQKLPTGCSTLDPVIIASVLFSISKLERVKVFVNSNNFSDNFFSKKSYRGGDKPPDNINININIKLLSIYRLFQNITALINYKPLL